MELKKMDSTARIVNRAKGFLGVTSGDYVPNTIVEQAKNLIRENDVEGIQSMLEENPRLVLDNKNLVKLSRTSEMVQALLQLEKLNAMDIEYRNGAKSLYKSESKVSVNAIGGSERELLVRTIKFTFETVLKLWPEVAIQVLDSQLQYEGFGPGDPDLEVTADFSILAGTILDTKKCCSIAKPEHLLHLAQLNVNYATSKEILLHPLVLVYVHRNLSCEWTNPAFKMLLFVIGLLFCFFQHFFGFYFSVCPMADTTSFSQFDPLGMLIGSSSLVLFMLLIPANVLAQLGISALYGFKYLSELFFSVCVAVMAFYVFKAEKANLSLTVLMLMLLLQALKSLSSTVLLGKTMLLAWGVARTLIKVSVPMLFVMLALTACSFVLHYDEVLKKHFDGDITTPLLFTKSSQNQLQFDSAQWQEKCALASPLKGNLFMLGKDSYLKSFYHVWNTMYGNTETADLTKDNSELDDEGAVLDNANSIQWIVSTVLTTIVLMNLLVALAIGDVAAIEKNADCQIVQAKLEHVYLLTASKNFCKMLCCCCCKKRRTHRGQKDDQGGDRVVTLYPNKFKEACTAKSRGGSWSQMNFLYTKQFVLGCSRIRKALLQKCNLREDPATACVVDQ